MCRKCATLYVMYWFENLPWWEKVPLIIGGAMMSAFSNSFPPGLQTAGLFFGIAMAAFGCLAVVWRFLKDWQRGIIKVEPYHLIMSGLIGATFFLLMASIGYIWQTYWPTAKNDDRIFPPTVTVTESTPFLMDRLPVVGMNVAFDALKTEHRIEFRIRVYNATGYSIEIEPIGGFVIFSDLHNQQNAVRLPTPLLQYVSQKPASSFKEEWSIALSQIVPASNADTLAALLDDDNVTTLFDMDGLIINVTTVENRKIIERLRLWNGVTCKKGICSGQLKKASMLEHMGISDSQG
jgi:hypothetical protein